MTVRIFNGDSRAVVRTLQDKSVQACVCSPPYFRLRDYRHAGQIGLEPTPEAYVAELVALFAEIRRVLRDDGSLWINIGDCYAGSGRGGNPTRASSTLQGSLESQEASMVVRSNWEIGASARAAANTERGSRLPAGLQQSAVAGGASGRAWEPPPVGYKNKELIGIPWKLAEALRADGWVLRQEIIWAKPNGMPESIRDRATRSHEHIFMFAKAKWIGPPPSRYAHITDQDARWLALFLDTEGNVCVKKAASRKVNTNYGAQICFAGTSRALIDRARHIIGDGTVLERKGKNAPMFYLQMSNNRAAELLQRIYPFLIVKPRQARLAIHLQQVIKAGNAERHAKAGRLRGKTRSDEYTAKLDRLWSTNKLLNKFGDPDISWVPEPKGGRWGDCETYYYGYDDVRLPPAPESVGRLARAMRGRLDAGNPQLVVSGGGYAPQGQPPHAGARKRDKQRGHSRRHAGFNDRWDGMSVAEQMAGGAAQRTVWWVAPGGFNDEFCLNCRTFYASAVLGDLRTEKVERDGRQVTLRYCRCGSCSDWLSHFAVMPEEVAAACILAGAPRGGVILDPFGGAGTTALVADRLQRDAILIELNPDYAEMAAHRVAASHPMLTDVTIETVPA